MPDNPSPVQTVTLSVETALFLATQFLIHLESLPHPLRPVDHRLVRELELSLMKYCKTKSSYADKGTQAFNDARQVLISVYGKELDKLYPK